MPRNRLKFIDGEEMFRVWTGYGKAGSLRLLREYCKSKGIRNPNTGHPPTIMACYNAMWRWAIRNLDLSRPLYAEYVLLFGDYLSDDEWNTTIESRAHALLTLAGYTRFIKKHPELESLYAKRYSVSG